MNQERQSFIIQVECEEAIKSLEHVYRQAFDRLTKTGLTERKVAALTQALLNSKEAATIPLQDVLNKIYPKNMDK